MNTLALLPLLPLLAFVLLGLVGYRLPKALVAFIGVGATCGSLAGALLCGWQFLAGAQYPLHRTLCMWLLVDGLNVPMGLTLDALSLVMCFVVTFVGSLIMLYSAKFMAEDDGYARFFAFMNLFVASMLVLVLADNLLLLYLGWEGVGLCSYLLIGFWYQDRANARAAFKAFLVTRVGDTAMAVGLFILFTQLGTLQIQPLLARAGTHWPVGSAWAVAAAALLLGGAVGKSAQLPLQTWLPNAMAGPTPVSALIHAATMVTAGVYLIARLHVIFQLAPYVQWLVGLIGAITLLLAACSALTQHDLKRVLAYSTMSQVGYMFLALGVGAWSGAIFHLFTHAFFKSLLFLGAGVVIASLDDEHDIHAMGGLRRDLPLVFWTFVCGAASLAALPWITAGFFSKDAILAAAWQAGQPGLWAAGLLGALLTSLYAFRLVFLVFFGEAKKTPQPLRGWAMALPLVVLAALALVAGYAHGPVTGLLGTVFPAAAIPEVPLLQWLAIIASLSGVWLAWVLYVRRPQWSVDLAAAPWARAIHEFWLSGWGFDWLYRTLFVAPFLSLAHSSRADVIDAVFDGLASGAISLNRLLGCAQTGRVRAYAAAVGLGAAIIIAVVVVMAR